MNRPLSILIAILALLGGLLLLIAGATFVVIYFKDAIFLRLGEADQSLIFWYLPFLFAGIAGLVCGLVIGQAGLRGLKSKSKTNPVEKTDE